MNESKDSTEPKPMESSKEAEAKSSDNSSNDKDSNSSDKNNNESFSSAILPVKDSADSDASAASSPQPMSTETSSNDENKTLEANEIKSPSDDDNQTNKENINSTSNNNDGEYSNFIYWRNSLPSLDENLAKESGNKLDAEPKPNTESQTPASSSEPNSSSQQQQQQEDLFNPNKPMTLESIISCKLTQSFGSLNSQGLYSSTNALNFFPPQPQQLPLNSRSLEQLSSELKQVS